MHRRVSASRKQGRLAIATAIPRQRSSGSEPAARATAVKRKAVVITAASGETEA